MSDKKQYVRCIAIAFEILRRHRARTRGVARRFKSDLSGATAVQAFVLLPAVLFAIFVGFKLWEAVDIRKDLHQATYVATRYLSLYPPDDTQEFYWEEIARKIIVAELEDNPFVDRQLNEVTLEVSVNLFDSNECGDEFVVEQTGHERRFADA